MAYTTATAVATLLGTSFSGSTEPTATEVNDIIARVEDYVEAYTGRIWSSATTTEYFDTLDEMRLAYGQPAYFPQDVQRTFFLTNRPVISIDSLQQNFQTSTDWESLATGYAEDALFYGGPGYVEFHNTPPPAGWKNVKITYTYGISTTPNDIKYATELLAASEIANVIKRASDQEGLSSVSIGDASYDFGNLAEQVKDFRQRALEILMARRTTVNVGML